LGPCCGKGELVVVAAGDGAPDWLTDGALLDKIASSDVGFVSGVDVLEGVCAFDLGGLFG